MAWVGLIIALSLAALPSFPTAASHWSNTGFLSPGTAYRGAATNFTFTLFNTAALETLRVSDVWIHLCWQPSDLGYYLKDNDGTYLTLPAAYPREFPLRVTVDRGAPQSCPWLATVNGQAPSDYFETTATYSGSIAIVEPPPLEVNVAPTPTSGTAPLDISFASTVTGGAPPFTYAWSFGDGSTSDQANPTHRYRDGGTYDVNVVVRDATATERQAATTVQVRPGAAFISGGPVGIAVLLAIVAAVGLLVTLFVLRARRRREAPAGTMPALYQLPVSPVEQPGPALEQAPMSQIQCPGCGGAIPFDSAFCRACGTPVMR